MTTFLYWPILRCVINLLVFFMKHPMKSRSVLLYWQEPETVSVLVWIINSWSWHINARRPKGWWKNSSELCKSKASYKLIKQQFGLNSLLGWEDVQQGWYILPLAQNDDNSCCLYKNVQSGTIQMCMHTSFWHIFSVPRITFHHFSSPSRSRTS